MNEDRRSAIIVGVLFLIATAAYIIGNGLIESVVSAPDYLHHVYSKKNQVILGVLLEFINSAAVVGIAIMLYPVLKKHNERIALGYVGFRVIEAIILIIGAIGPLLLIRLSQQYTAAGADGDSYFHTIGALAAEASSSAFQIAMLALGLYSLLFCYLLYQTGLIPRSLSVLGFIGYLSLSASAILELMGHNGMLLYIPGALFEIILPVWLIVKGFNLVK